jgi:flagellar biosynthesis protein FlhF
MKVKRFFAMSSRDALKMVRRELGSDAVIISNRMVNEGNEILAVRGDDIDSLISPNILNEDVTKIDLMSMTEKTRLEGKSHELNGRLNQSLKAATSPSTKNPTPNLNHTDMSEVMKEIRQMRDAFESKFNELSWRETQRNEPVKTEVLRNLLAVGFGVNLSRYMVEHLPPKLNHEDSIRWVKSTLSNNLTIMSDESEILDQEGIFALVGPTGVGKTTTIAKIAARYVMKHGAENLALITTDAYRIGGHDQLRSYGKILGVMVHAVKDETDLKLALEAFKGKHTVLIDTAGVSQRNTMVDEQSDMLFKVKSNIKKILCLNAATHMETLAEVVAAYGKTGLHGAIVTKVDEAVSLGGVLDVVVREKIKVYYLTNGQRVPDDIHLLNKTSLIQHAFEAKERLYATKFNDDELPFVMASQVYRGANLELSHV